MYKKIKFIGRENELNEIKSYITLPHKNHIVFLEAGGGLGKTRLLLELEDIYKKNDKYYYGKIFDYDNEQFFSMNKIKNNIIDTIGQDGFKDYHKIEKQYKSKTIVVQELLNKTFSDCFNKKSINKKFILLIDTAEKSKNNKFWNEFRKLLEKLDNIFVIIAGRSYDHDGKEFNRKELFFNNKISNYNLVTIKLKKFIKKESLEYFSIKSIEDKIEITKISDTLLGCIIILSEGKPIILDLAISWIINSNYQNNPHKFILEKLEIDNCDILARYNPGVLIEKQKQLVTYFENNDNNIKKIIHILLFIPKIKFEMLEFFDKTITRDDFDELRKYVFIKVLDDSYITLHDEMERLLSEYIIPKIDADGKLKQQYSNLIIPFYENEISRFENELKYLIETEDRFRIQRNIEFDTLELIRHLFISQKTNEAMDKLTSTLVKERNNGNYEFIQTIIESLKNENAEKWMSLSQETDFITMQAKSLSSEWKNIEAQNLIEEFEHNNRSELTEFMLANLRNMLAGINTSRGDLIEALRNQSFAYGVFEKEKKDNLKLFSGIHMGITYYRTGEYNKAIIYLERSMRLLKSLKQDENLQATILNHLASAYKDSGQNDQALIFATKALEIWKKNNTHQKIGIANITLANIYRDQNRYDIAEEYYSQAMELLNDNDDIEPYMNLLINYAKFWLYQNDFTQAKEHAEYVNNRAKKYGYNTEHIESSSILRNIYWGLKEYQNAKKELNEFYELSKKYGNVYYQVDGILGFVEFAYQERVDNLENIIFEYASQLMAYKEGYDFPHLYGRMKLYQAKILFDNGKYNDAIEYYKKAFNELSRYGTYTIQSVDNELEDLINNLKKLEDSQMVEYLEDLQQEWKDNPKLFQWCKTVLLFLDTGL